MSKLTRREFKELLIEWKQSFINERVTPKVELSGMIKNKYPIDVIFAVSEYDDYENIYNKFDNNIYNVLRKDSSLNFKSELTFEDVPLIIEKNSQNIEFMLENLSFEGIPDQEKHLRNSINNDDLLIIINFQIDQNERSKEAMKTMESGGIFDIVKYKVDSFNQNDKLKDIISWTFHDLFHSHFDVNVVAGESMQNYINKTIENSLSDDSSIKKRVDFMGDKVSFFGNESEKMHASGIVDEIVEFFEKENFTKGVAGFDIPGSMFAYSLLMIQSEEDINKLSLSNDSKEYFKEFYNLTKKAIEGMSLIKNKILFAGNLGS